MKTIGKRRNRTISLSKSINREGLEEGQLMAIQASQNIFFFNL
jgi:hypothetical protein